MADVSEIMGKAQFGRGLCSGSSSSRKQPVEEMDDYLDKTVNMKLEIFMER